MSMRSRIRNRGLRTSEVPASKEQIALGLAQTRALIEMKNAGPNAHRWIEELIEEGKAFAGTWERHPKTGEIYRVIYHRPLKPDEKVRKDEHN